MNSTFQLLDKPLSQVLSLLLLPPIFIAHRVQQSHGSSIFHRVLHIHDKTRQDKTRQDKTRQDKTRQDKTRQDKTSTLRWWLYGEQDMAASSKHATSTLPRYAFASPYWTSPLPTGVMRGV